MSDELPPTSSLRAFARAASTLSFKIAAKELHLSPSTLSRQIKTLEEHLGATLFRRLNPGLKLTDAGSSYLTTVNRALSELRSAQEGIAPGFTRPLRVSTLESFSSRWLVPRLPEFRAAHPKVTLEIEATFDYADFDRDPVDVAIRFGSGNWEGLHSEPLVDLAFFPVCSPDLSNGDPPLRGPAELVHHTLIHISQVPNAWRYWLRRAGHVELEPRENVTYDHVAIALSAAESGQGVALSTQFLCGAELASGRLFAPFELQVRSPQTYHLVCREENLDDPRVTALRDWLVESLE